MERLQSSGPTTVLASTANEFSHSETSLKTETNAAGASCDLSEQSISMETVIILDWDDTLLPSSWISQNGYRLDSELDIDPKTQAILDVLEESVASFLQTVSQYGTCVIVTNAESGWVELSCAKFLPRITHLVNTFKILSARSTFEPMFPGSPIDWKYAAFTDVVREALMDYDSNNSNIVKNIISCGDSMHEREAIHLVTEQMTHVYTKSIKFVDRPSLEQLRQQVDMIQRFFSQICDHNDHLDLMLSLPSTSP